MRAPFAGGSTLELSATGAWAKPLPVMSQKWVRRAIKSIVKRHAQQINRDRLRLPYFRIASIACVTRLSVLALQ
jgi:hypothetical protein